MAMVWIEDGLPVISTPKQMTRSLRIAATTICLGFRRPALLSRPATRSLHRGIETHRGQRRHVE